jgi:hypothetical protein
MSQARSQHTSVPLNLVAGSAVFDHNEDIAQGSSSNLGGTNEQRSPCNGEKECLEQNWKNPKCTSDNHIKQERGDITASDALYPAAWMHKPLQRDRYSFSHQS